MIILYHERGRIIPNESGIEALKAWVEHTDNIGEKGARVLHIKSLHTKRGIGAKALGFLWLDVPFRAAGAAIRAGYQPVRTCPLCLALAEAGLNSRGKSYGSVSLAEAVMAVHRSEITQVETKMNEQRLPRDEHAEAESRLLLNYVVRKAR